MPKDNPNLYTEQGFVEDLISTRNEWKNSNSRKHWESIWKEAEERWQLKTKDKDEKWMTNTSTTETHIACEGAVSEIADMIFGGDQGLYFGTRKAGTKEGSPLLDEYMRIRLDHQIKIKQKALGQYGLRQLVIKGSMPFKVVWKREPGYQLAYKPQIDPMTGMPVDYTVEKIWSDTAIDRPDVKFIDLSNFIVEPGATSFEDAVKYETEEAVRSVVNQTYKLNLGKLDEYPNPKLNEDEIKKRKDGFSDPDADLKRSREIVCLTHVWKWFKVAHITKLLSGVGQTEQPVDYSQEYTPEDAQEPPTEAVPEIADDNTERFYHIVIANDKILLHAEESEYWVEQDPYGMATFIPVDGEMYGIGIPYVAKSSQDQLKDIRDMSLDNIKLRLYTMLKYRPNSSVSKLTLKLRPMGTIPDYTGRDIIPLEIPDATSSSLQREAALNYQLQETTKVTKLTTGNQPSGTDTATTTSILYRQSNKAFKTLSRWIGDNFVVPMCRKVYALDRQLSTPQDIGRLLGGSDMMKTQQVTIEWGQVPPEQVFQDVEFEWVDAVDKVADQLAAQQIKEMFPSLVQFPWFNAVEATRRVFQRLGERTDNLIFSPEQMQGMLQPGLMPAPGQGGNAPNSATGNSPVPESFMKPQANGGNANAGA